jgi:hypothetical protein
VAQLRQELAKAQAEFKAKDDANTATTNQLRGQLKSLKIVGRKFREDFNKSNEEKAVLEKEKEALEAELKKVKSLEEGINLMEELAAEHDRLKEKYEETKKREEELVKKEARAMDILKIAKEKLDVTMKQNEELKEQLNEKEARLAAKEGGSDIDIMKSAALVSQVKKLQEEKSNLERMIAEERNEIERLRQEMEASAAATQAASAAATQAATKPVAVAVAGVVQAQQSVVQAQPQRKQVQAHVQPHRHQPRDEHRPTQTASIRPMTQQRAAVQAQAVVLPTSQVSSGQLEVATVQPTLAVSVSVSASASSGPQLPSTSQQAAQPIQPDPLAAEFVPTDRSSSASEAIDTSEDHSRALVSLRNDQPQASTSGPAHPSHSAQTSTSGGTPTTASVPPNMKRPRETPDSDSQMSEERAGPSGVQKKARTISSTEQFGDYDQVSSGTTDTLELAGVSGSQDLESDSSAQAAEAELREVGSSSQLGDSVGTSFEIAASSGVRSYATVASSDTSGVGCSGQANSTSQEDDEVGEMLDMEQGGEEDMEEGEISEDVEEEADIPEEDELNDDQDLEPSAEQDLGEVEEVVGGEEGLASSDEEEEGRENQPAAAPEDVNEDNSSEPSSSTGTSQIHRASQQQQQQQAPGHQALGIETDVGQVSLACLSSCSFSVKSPMA